MTEAHPEKESLFSGKNNWGVHYNSIPMAKLAATLAGAMALKAPPKAHPPVHWMNEIIRARLGIADRIVMYHADAVPMYIYQKYTHIFAPVLKHIEITAPFLSTVESVTPVSHASMYTGVEPEVHGIKTYVRPCLTCDTLYDAFIRQGKRCAIVAMEDSSFLHIFKNRDMDYFELQTAEEIIEKACDLIAQDRHDLISIHVFTYDSFAHHFGPESVTALDAIVYEAELFDRLINCIKEKWTDHHKTLYGYAPDHGQHEIQDMKGAHGSILPEDMNVMHFYGINSASHRS
ncbi:MAG: alkaline phosphatase family protein [Treponema sp.]|jgi:predicted AlkP superfamily pyrophosphatase or phosphodiesterase|nr:alkaline phosphatase family protein [Treponema sp.]